jgi:serine/threonine-protein kinase
MSEVHLAHHELLKRPTAVKILAPGRADAEAAARFEREARLVSRLSHPNTVQLYDFGRTPDGRFYLAMEYLEGVTLAQLVALEGPLPPERAVHLLRQAAGSLAEAHASGLVHRDIKPTNVMVCRRGGAADVVKVLDFGIARSVLEEETHLTKTHEISGTPLYIAPERIRSPRTNDPRSDLYSLGAVAYLLVTGRAVFEGPGPAEVLYQVMSAEPPPPSRLRGSPLPGDLEALILECLAKEPDARPQGARFLQERLDALPCAGRWTGGQADAWWAANEARFKAQASL